MRNQRWWLKNDYGSKNDNNSFYALSMIDSNSFYALWQQKIKEKWEIKECQQNYALWQQKGKMRSQRMSQSRQ